MKTRGRFGACIVAAAIILFGIGVLWSTTHIPVNAAFAKIGPRAFPYAIGAVLVGLGLVLLYEAYCQRWACEATDPDEPSPDLLPLAWVGAGLLANVLLIEVIGFILSSTVMYVLVARGFGAKRLWLAAVVGFLLALLAYYGFAQLLGLRMGGGLIEDLI